MSGITRLYVHAADTKTHVELRRYLRGLAPDDYWLEGTGPMSLAVCFPRPRLSVISKETEAERERAWTRELTSLPVRRAALRLAGNPAAVVEVALVPDPGQPPGFERFLSAAVAGGGQSSREISEAQEWRRNQVERVVDGEHTNQDCDEEKPPTKFEDTSQHTRRKATPARNGMSSVGTAEGLQRRIPHTPVGTIAEDGSLA